MTRYLAYIGLVLAIHLAACARSDAPRPVGPPPPAWHTTPAGVAVAVPWWLDRPEHADLVREALDEVDAAHDFHGVAPGEVTTEIVLPVIAVWPHGLARGVYRTRRRHIEVSWRLPGGSRPLLPAMRHELGHHVYGPCYEHDPCEREGEQ
jgi:hypothetical protein